PLDRIVGRSCIATGWGLTHSGIAGVDKILHKATFTVLPQAVCKEKWQEDDSDGRLCFANGTKSICAGDSGGPLNASVRNGGYRHGVSSFVAGDCDPNQAPDVAARVSHYSEWIWNTIEQLS